jgi:3-hydroxymyristoyl/3-hydroxydecanoyl-(acyl carrier protein) dehydratase
VKCVSLAEDVFADHFPGHPIMPGALILEALAQLGGVLLEATHRQRGHGDAHALLTMVDRARFRRRVTPGDKLDLEARVLVVSTDGGKIEANAGVDGKKVADMTLGFAFVPVTNPIVVARRREVLAVWLRGSSEEP